MLIAELTKLVCMDKSPRPSPGRPRGAEAASTELKSLDSLGLARWAAAAEAGGLSRRSAAQLAGVSKRHLQRLLAAHADDPAVQRDRLLSDAIRWEQQGARTLSEACSRAAEWMRSATNNPNADAKEVAAAFGATVAASHRLAEIGSRRAKRLTPEQQPKTQRFDLQGFLSSVADACAEVRQLPPDQQEAGWEALRERLRTDQQGQALEPIDVEVVPVNSVEPG